MDENKVDTKEVVQLARLALLGNRDDIQLFVRRLANRYRAEMPGLSEQLGGLLREAPKSSQSSLLRKQSDTETEMSRAPIDKDSKLSLVRVEHINEMPIEPIWVPSVWQKVSQIVSERAVFEALTREGLKATSSALFTGAPGVGKTLAARWIAYKLKRPLMTLDLSAVISSFLGKTGHNVRSVLDYARNTDCVLLLDEFDAVAKRRDDAVELGELKRLVTVLLQEIDNWPDHGILLAATNHPELLDPAVWRRFDVVVEFPMPDASVSHNAISRFLKTDNQAEVGLASILLQGLSFSDMQREVSRARRWSVVHGATVHDALKEMVIEHVNNLSKHDRARVAEELMKVGYSQRQVKDLVHLSRDTIRKHVKSNQMEQVSHGE